MDHGPVILGNSFKYVIFTLILLGFSQFSYADLNLHVNYGSTVPAPTGAKDLCQKYDFACKTNPKGRQFIGMTRGQLTRFNSKINGQYRQVNDNGEDWSLPKSSSSGGDCEDFALLKKKLLIEKGVAPQSLLIATVIDRGQSHAVLVWYDGKNNYVLDNLRNEVQPYAKAKLKLQRIQNPRNPTAWLFPATRGAGQAAQYTTD